MTNANILENEKFLESESKLVLQVLGLIIQKNGANLIISDSLKENSVVVTSYKFQKKLEEYINSDKSEGLFWEDGYTKISINSIRIFFSDTETKREVRTSVFQHTEDAYLKSILSFISNKDQVVKTYFFENVEIINFNYFESSMKTNIRYQINGNNIIVFGVDTSEINKYYESDISMQLKIIELSPINLTKNKTPESFRKLENSLRKLYLSKEQNKHLCDSEKIYNAVLELSILSNFDLIQIFKKLSDVNPKFTVDELTIDELHHIFNLTKVNYLDFYQDSDTKSLKFEIYTNLIYQISKKENQNQNDLMNLVFLELQPLFNSCDKITLLTSLLLMKDYEDVSLDYSLFEDEFYNDLTIQEDILIGFLFK